MNDADRLRFLFASAFQDGDAADGCPTPEALLDTLELRLGADERGAVVDHLGDCPVCAEAWRLLRIGRDV